jgi:hypothetical protein
MELVKVESLVRRRPQRGFGQDLFHRVVGRLVQAPGAGLHEEVAAVLKVDYVEPFFDVRYWLLRSLRVLASKLSAAAAASEAGQGSSGSSKAQRRAAVAAVFKLLLLVTVPKMETEIISFFVPFVEEEEAAAAAAAQAGEGEQDEEGKAGEDDFLDFDYGDDGDDGEEEQQGGEDEEPAGAGSSNNNKAAGVPLVARLSAHRKALGEAWVACLRLELTPALYRSTTQFVARHVVEAMLNPLQVRPPVCLCVVVYHPTRRHLTFLPCLSPHPAAVGLLHGGLRAGRADEPGGAGGPLRADAGPQPRVPALLR